MAWPWIESGFVRWKAGDWLGTDISHEIDLKVQFVLLREHCLAFISLFNQLDAQNFVLQ
jgi:hypothetical protein